MKKTFKCLTLFIFLLLVGVKVDAATPYQKDWSNYYWGDQYYYFYDVVGLDDGSINLGCTDYEKVDGNYFYGSSIIKYDKNGDEVWKNEKEYYYFLKGTETSDGVVVLAQYYDDDDVVYVSLLKYNFNGELVWEKKIDDVEINYDYIDLLSLENYNDKIVLAFNYSVYVYDNDGNKLKDFSNEDWLLPGITINSDGIYIVSIDKNANTVLEKYDSASYKKLDSKVIFSGTIVDGEIADFTLPLSIQTVKNNIVLSSYTVSGISEILIFNEKIELIKHGQINTLATEIQEERNSFLVVGRQHDNDPKGIDRKLLNYVNNLEEFSFDIPDSKASSHFYSNLDKYNFDLGLEWRIEVEDGYINGIDKTNDGFVIVWENNYGDIYSDKYIYPVLEEKWKTGLESESIDEYLYDVVTHENGYIAVGWTEDSPPRGVSDAKLALAENFGRIVSYDKDGKLLFSFVYGDAYTHFIRVDIVEDGYIILAHDYEESVLELIKLDFDGGYVGTINVDDRFYGDEYDYRTVKMSVFGEYIVVLYNGKAKLFDLNGNYVDLLEDENLRYQAFDPDGEYIYFVCSNDEDDGLYLNKYNLEFEKVSSNLLFYDSYHSITDLDIYNNKFYLLTWLEMYIINEDYEVEKNLEIHDNYFNVVGTNDGFVLGGSVPCAEGAPGAHCEYEGFLMAYNSKTDRIKYIALDFLPYGIDSVDDSIITVGFGMKDYEYPLSDVVYSRIAKYSYPSFSIDISTDGNGTITSNKVMGITGEEVEFSVEPKEGYILKRVVVTTISGEVLEFNDYKFVMPSEDVEIYAEFELIPNNPNTGLRNPLVIFSIILGVSFISYLVIKKKKFI